jgi:hypothetical protein
VSLPQQPRVGGPGGEVVSSLEELYQAAEVGRKELQAALEALASRHPGAELKIAPLKARERAIEKAQGESLERRPRPWKGCGTVLRCSDARTSQPPTFVSAVDGTTQQSDP